VSCTKIPLNTPLARLVMADLAIGCWKKTSNACRQYLSVKLDDPSFPARIYASPMAVEDSEEFALIWSRRTTE
jgi:uncharacterized protein (DUF736 family)